jgi:hypothetical protein
MHCSSSPCLWSAPDLIVVCLRLMHADVLLFCSMLMVSSRPDCSAGTGASTQASCASSVSPPSLTSGSSYRDCSRASDSDSYTAAFHYATVPVDSDRLSPSCCVPTRSRATSSSASESFFVRFATIVPLPPSLYGLRHCRLPATPPQSPAVPSCQFTGSARRRRSRDQRRRSATVTASGPSA